MNFAQYVELAGISKKVPELNHWVSFSMTDLAFDPLGVEGKIDLRGWT